ncbi:MAG TPA: sigma-70 family RNA polymerase sigma factor [Acidobacteriaceae bacterium]|nr:sigma-70 family RNA polymerase sigma factor [Acidobacteriaceae bacterium]
MRPELAEAIALLRSGDESAIQHALALLQRTVLSFGIKVCGHREDAEDTAQEVLIRALPHLAKLEDPQALSAWLYTAAKNRCWQGRRRATYRKTVALDQLLPDDTELHALLLADPGASPEDEALRRRDHRMLHEAVLALPPQYRIVLVLHDMEELDSSLVAKILSIQPGTVRVRLHRARLLVRKEMAKLLERRTAAPRRKKAVKRPAQCREIFANLSEYLDGKLEPESCERMRRHIEACPACVAFIEDLKRAIDRCRAFDVFPDEEARPVLRRLLTEEYVRLKNSAANL